MVPVFYSIHENVLNNIGNITGIFYQFFTQFILCTHTGDKKRIRDNMLPIKRIRQLSYIYNEKQSVH